MWYPGAQNKAIDVNYAAGGNRPRLLIVHIMEGTLQGTDSWFRNPASQVSAHFGTGRDGTLYQWVSTGDRAWHAMAANSYSIGVENEGDSGEELTALQLEVLAELLAWAHDQYPDIALWLNTRPYDGRGLSWHGLGGAPWGNHPDCPGLPIVRQLREVLDKARTAHIPLA